MSIPITIPLKSAGLKVQILEARTKCFTGGSDIIARITTYASSI